MRREIVDDMRKRSRQQHVVAVEIGHDLAVDAGKAKIDGVGLAPVGLALPADAVAPAHQEIDRAVDRGAVLNVIIEVRVSLVDDAVDRGADILCMVVARRDHCDPRRVRRNRRRGPERVQVEQARRILLEGPHRRTPPEVAKRSASLTGRNETEVPLQQRDAVFELFESVSETLPELFVHLPRIPARPRRKIRTPSYRSTDGSASSAALDVIVGYVSKPSEGEINPELRGCERLFTIVYQGGMQQVTLGAGRDRVEWPASREHKLRTQSLGIDARCVEMDDR